MTGPRGGLYLRKTGVKCHPPPDEYPSLLGAWHCVIPGTPTRHDETVDIELRKFAVHDNAYVIRGEFPVWGNGEGLSLKYTDNMEVIFFNGVPCQEIKDGNK
jgi:hypothetical protein